MGAVVRASAGGGHAQANPEKYFEGEKKKKT
jgi:hypothetical protein